MSNEIIEKTTNDELVELTHDTEQQKKTPAEEYRKGLRRRRAVRLLFALLFLVECTVCHVLCGGVFAEDLHYRVTKQIENDRTGQNVFSSGVYTGELDFGYFVGDADFKYSTGSSYVGQWANNHMEGLGVLSVPSVGVYDGEFLHSEKNGTGIFTWEDGAVYEGEWKNDQMEGQGEYTSPDEVVYVGTFSGNMFQAGSCEFSNTTGEYVAKYKDFVIDNLLVTFSDGTTYDGNTDGVTLSGTGRMQFANGDTYSGNYANGLRDGQGVYTWSNGDVYDGSWSEDLMNGSGKYTYADGSCAQGKFEDNQFIEGSYNVVNDFGDYTFIVEDMEIVSVDMVLSNGTTYSGDMEDGELTGTAQIKYSNGDKFSGKVVDGYKNGQGSYIWSDGASYEGDWENDKMNGRGTYYYSDAEDGYKLSGEFVNGKPNGSCTYYVSSYESYKTDWTNGKCVKVYE